MFENDYIMRQIETMSRVLGKILLQKDTESEEMFIVDEQGNISRGKLLLYQIKKSVLEKKINEAENLLFDAIEQEPIDEYLQVAITFYDELQKMSDNELNVCDFSREEIYDGLKQIQNIYNNNHFTA